MVHGFGQQVMRQDPAYYFAYVALRLDNAWPLVSFDENIVHKYEAAAPQQGRILLRLKTKGSEEQRK